MTVLKALKLMGLRIKADIQAKILADVPPPNASSTILKKTRSIKGKRARGYAIADAALFGEGTLRDTGQMLNAIDYQVRERLL